MNYNIESFCLRMGTLLLLACASCKKENRPEPSPVPVNPKPVANAAFSILSQHSPALVKFTNQSQNATVYKWYVGNELVSGDQNPELIIRNTGSNTVKLVAKNSARDSSVKSFSIAVNKDPLLLHHFTFSGDFANTGSSSIPAGSMDYAFAPDRKQAANSAVYFNGVNTFAILPNGVSGASQDSISISLWLKPEDLTRAGVVFGYQSASLNNVPVHFVPAIYYSATGKLYAGAWHGKFTEGITASSMLRNWLHVVVAANGAGQDIYVNGEKVKSIEGRGADGHMPFAYLGAGYTNNGWTELAQGNNYFKGWIDDVRIYKKKLNANEAKALFRE